MISQLELSLMRLQQPKWIEEAQHHGYAFTQLITFLAACEQICDVYGKDLIELINESATLPNGLKTLLFIAMILRLEEVGVRAVCENIDPIDQSVEIQVDENVSKLCPQFSQTAPRWLSLTQFTLYRNYCMPAEAHSGQITRCRLN